jgi:cholesterol oxidase
MVGCRYNSKNTLVKNYLYLAEKLGVTIFSEIEATLIRECPDGGYQVEAVSSTSIFSRKRHLYKSQKLVLAAGVLGTLNLLFKCREQGTLQGTLTRLSPMLGARVRTNSESLTGASAKSKDVDYSQGITITSSIYPDEVTHIEPVRYPVGSDVMSLLATVFVKECHPVIRPLKWLWQILCHPLNFLRTLWPLGWAQRTIILLVMQTLDNSVRVFRRRRWWWPFKWKLVSERENRRKKIPACIPQAQQATKVLAQKINGIPQNAINEVLFNIGTTAHILGGCALGSDPEKGVIDSKNRVFGYSGMYIIDGSMIPAKNMP